VDGEGGGYGINIIERESASEEKAMAR